MAKISSLLISIAALMMIAPLAMAADAERNDRLFDSTGASVAKVLRVADDGDVLVIYKGKVRRIEASTLSNVDGKLVTALTRIEIRHLN